MFYRYEGDDLFNTNTPVSIARIATVGKTHFFNGTVLKIFTPSVASHCHATIPISHNANIHVCNYTRMYTHTHIFLKMCVRVCLCAHVCIMI